MSFAKTLQKLKDPNFSDHNLLIPKGKENCAFLMQKIISIIQEENKVIEELQSENFAQRLERISTLQTLTRNSLKLFTAIEESQKGAINYIINEKTCLDIYKEGKREIESLIFFLRDKKAIPAITNETIIHLAESGKFEDAKHLIEKIEKPKFLADFKNNTLIHSIISQIIDIDYQELATESELMTARFEDEEECVKFQEYADQQFNQIHIKKSNLLTMLDEILTKNPEIINIIEDNKTPLDLYLLADQEIKDLIKIFEKYQAKKSDDLLRETEQKPESSPNIKMSIKLGKETEFYEFKAISSL